MLIIFQPKSIACIFLTLLVCLSGCRDGSTGDTGAAGISGATGPVGPAGATGVITMDASVSPNSQIVSSNFVNTVAQPAGTVNYWYNNPTNPLYMMCVSYQVNAGTNQLSSNAACGGATDQCITYSFQ